MYCGTNVTLDFIPYLDRHIHSDIYYNSLSQQLLFGYFNWLSHVLTVYNILVQSLYFLVIALSVCVCSFV
ncbi:hypothetical protein FKM82_016839 [Ascaphus truei]